MKQENLCKIISIILLLLWCSLIFYFSNQVGAISEESSSRVLLFLDNIFKTNLTNSLLATIIIRKCAHMFLYFILYLICLYVGNSYNIKKKILFCFVFCLIYSLSDEIHQLFIYERSFGIIDILIDMIGSSIAYLFIKLFKHKKLSN